VAAAVILGQKEYQLKQIIEKHSCNLLPNLMRKPWPGHTSFKIGKAHCYLHGFHQYFLSIRPMHLHKSVSSDQKNRMSSKDLVY
jgi:hypothetical protein